MTIRDTADRMDRILQKEQPGKYRYTISQSEKQELNLENGGFKLLRTVLSNSASLRVFQGAKMGAASGNDITETGLEKLAAAAKAAAESASEDPCHDIAPDQGKDVFLQGNTEPDMDRFIERIKEFLKTAAEEYPKVRIMSGIGSYDRWNWISRNSNGTEFEARAGQYHFSVEICASDGDKTTGLDYTGFSTKTLDVPFMEMGDLRRRLEDIQKSIEPERIQGKFEGPVIITPGCAEDFIFMTLSNYIGEGVIVNGTSQWLDKVGEQVADEKLTISLKPFDDRIVTGERATANGFRTEEVTLIDKGVLKTHWLNLYAANKTGHPVMKNSGSGLVMKAGEQSLEEIVGGIEKGLLVGGFSGGQPGTNGEFSGVAKNSFLIENGRVTRAVTETMINGNLGDMLRHVRGISRERDVQGVFTLPYLAVDGIVISGK